MNFFRASFLASALAVASFTVSGCSLGNFGASGKAVTMADAFDLDIFGPHEDDLHTPYVAGAQFDITVTSAGSSSATDGVTTGWTLSSSDPNVIRVTSALSGGTATVNAGSPGQAVLTVANAAGVVVDSHAVSVAIPDQVSLYAQGLLLTGAADAVAQVTEASIVANGEATFLVRYFAQGAELYGNGALHPTASPGDGITATTVSASFASARDFLQVSAPAMGTTGTVSLVVDNVVVGEVPITSVAASAVSHVTILSQSTDASQKGDSVALYAHAVDATSADVYGASFAWSVDGASEGSVALGGPADLFFYTFDSAATETVSASYDGFTPSLTVAGQGGSVGSTAAVGCAVAAGLGAGSGRSPAGSPLPRGAGAAFVAAIAAGLACARARPRRQRGARPSLRRP